MAKRQTNPYNKSLGGAPDGSLPLNLLLQCSIKPRRKQKLIPKRVITEFIIVSRSRTCIEKSRKSSKPATLFFFKGGVRFGLNHPKFLPF